MLRACFREHQLAGSRRSPPESAIFGSVQDFRQLSMPRLKRHDWPCRLQNSILFAVCQYHTALKNHVCVHFESRMTKHVTWMLRLKFSDIIKHQQDSAWRLFQSSFDQCVSEPRATLPQEVLAYVTELVNIFFPLIPASSRFPNPMSNAQLEHSDSWHQYWKVLRCIAVDWDRTVVELESRMKETCRPPKTFSSVAIVGFQVNHVMLDDEGIKEVCSLHRRLSGKSVRISDRAISAVFKTNLVQHRSLKTFFAGTLSTDDAQVYMQKLLRVPVQSSA